MTKNWIVTLVDCGRAEPPFVSDDEERARAVERELCEEFGLPLNIKDRWEAWRTVKKADDHRVLVHEVESQLRRGDHGWAIIHQYLEGVVFTGVFATERAAARIERAFRAEDPVLAKEDQSRPADEIINEQDPDSEYHVWAYPIEVE